MESLRGGRDLWVWLGVFLVVMFLFWWFSSILFPFVFGFVLAYVLRPCVVWLEERWGLGRSFGSFFLTVFVFIFVIFVLTVGFPLFVGELVQFIQKLPDLFEGIEELWEQWRDRFLFLSDRLELDVVGLVKTHVSEGLRLVVSSLLSLASGVGAFFGMLSLVVLSPFATFYFLRDWDRVMESLESWIPLKHRDFVLDFSRSIDKELSGFVRGQLSVSLASALYYGVGLSVLGVYFGVLLGLVMGLLSLLPYVGFALGSTLVIFLTFFQFYGGGDWVLMLVLVVALLSVGQFLEGFVLQPWLIGQEVDVNGLWLIFSLMAGGFVGGFWGILLAIPGFLVLRECLRLLGSYYRGSGLYGRQEEE
jgi:predicted PurR-regulated permease PerM